MKNSFAVLFGLMAVFVSQASSASIVERISQFTYIKPACDMCEGGTSVTETTFKFSSFSCRGFSNEDFSVAVEVKRMGIMGDTETFVTVKQNGDLIDCAGPTRKHTYEIKTEALAKGQRYILGNPSVMQPVPN